MTSSVDPDRDPVPVIRAVPAVQREAAAQPDQDAGDEQRGQQQPGQGRPAQGAGGAGSALPVWAGSPAGTAVCLLVMVSYAGVARPAW